MTRLAVHFLDVFKTEIVLDAAMTICHWRAPAERVKLAAAAFGERLRSGRPRYWSVLASWTAI